jgi:hypothetical protein
VGGHRLQFAASIGSCLRRGRRRQSEYRDRQQPVPEPESRGRFAFVRELSLSQRLHRRLAVPAMS